MLKQRRSLSLQEEQKLFFFADGAYPEHYDSTIDLVAPLYRQMHELMLDLAGLAINNSGDPVYALDIGSGTGAEAIRLLGRFKTLRLIALDNSDAMHDVFRQNAQAQGIDDNRYRCVTQDVLRSDPGNLCEIAKDTFGCRNFDLVTSAFTIHHFSPQDKQEIYTLCCSLLKRGGLALFGDLFNYENETSDLSEYFARKEESWISDNFTTKAREARQEGNNDLADHYQQLRDEWVFHYTGGENKLGGLEDQLRVLRTVCFDQAACVMRYWQVGLLYAKKS